MSMSLRTSSLPKLMDSPLAARAESVHRSGYKPRQPDNGIVDVLRLTSDHSVHVDACRRLTPPMRPKNPGNFFRKGPFYLPRRPRRPATTSESAHEAPLPRLMVRSITGLTGPAGEPPGDLLVV